MKTALHSRNCSPWLTSGSLLLSLVFGCSDASDPPVGDDNPAGSDAMGSFEDTSTPAGGDETASAGTGSSTDSPANTGGASGDPPPDEPLGGSGGVAESGGAANGGMANQPAMFMCPDNVEAPQLEGVSAQPVDGVPLMDGFGEGFSIIEGPVWLDGSLYFTHIAANDGKPPAARILKLAPGQAPVAFLEDGGANGLAISSEGQLLAGRHADGSISSIAVDDQAIDVVADGYMGSRFNSPNDLTVRSDGNIYFTDPDYQAPEPKPQAQTRVYRIDPDGALSVIVEDRQQPNGITLSLDESVLYIAGQGPVMQHPVMDDGTVGAGQQFGNVFGGDGMVLDCAGNLYITHNNQVSVLDPAGQELGSISIDGVQAATNVAFGGPERKTLYITSLDSSPKLFQAELNVPGLPY